MKGADVWYGTIGIALISVFFGAVAFIAYLLYGPPISHWPFGNASQATSTKNLVTLVDLSGQEGILFICESGKSLKVVFPINEARLALSDGRRISLPQVVSASGARYANPDESFVFWNKSNTAFIEENGTMTYSGCVTRVK